MPDKKEDLTGPGIGNYEELERILPQDYNSLLTPRETQKALFALKNYIEENLCNELNLIMVAVPLIVDVNSGVNDLLDRDGSRTPIQFHISNDYDKNPIDAQIVQAATKWKRTALKQFCCEVGEGICTDMKAVRKDYFLDHDHSAYVDQWDWEQVITRDHINLQYLNDKIPLSIGGGIGQSRTYMYLLNKAHIGEVSVSVWPKILKDTCRKKNIHVLE